MLASPSAPEASGPRGVAASGRPRRTLLRRLIAGVLLAGWLGTAYWQTHKPLPPGTHVEGAWSAQGPQDARFIADITTADAYGRPVQSHAIFDEMLSVTHDARTFLVIDTFRFESREAAARRDSDPARARPLAAEFRDALIARKREEPHLRVLLIVDPVNDAYGSFPSPDLERLKGAGIDVVVTDLDPLRDSNFLYSSLWRLGARWLKPRASAPDSGWLPSPRETGPDRVTAAAWLAAANLKADRRDVVIGDDGHGGLAGVLAATELGEQVSADSNVGIRLDGPVLLPLLESEIEVARFSGWTGVLGAPVEGGAMAEGGAPARAGGDPPSREAPSREGLKRAGPGDQMRSRILTEGAIRDALLARIDASRAGDAIDIAAFYLSERSVIESLVAASRRGVAVRLILDPGEDAFGRGGTGIPNSSVAGELLAASDGAIRVRWYRTHGERFHAALALIYGPQRLWLTVGSANLTRRSLEDYDLDANAALDVRRDSALAAQAIDYFETLWSNKAALGIEYTADVGVYADASQLHYWRYRLMEATGLAMF